MKFDQIKNSPYFKWTVLILLELIIILGVFRLGMIVGFKKANFSYMWGEDQHRPFVMMDPRFRFGFKGPNEQDFTNAHGTAGTITKIEKNILTIKEYNENEKTVEVPTDILIQYHRDKLNSSDLKAGDEITIIGSPGDSGSILARVIRVFNKAK